MSSLRFGAWVLALAPAICLADGLPLPFSLASLATAEQSGAEAKTPLKDGSWFKNTERSGGGKVIFRGAWTYLGEGDRGNEVFTDVNGSVRQNDDHSGWGVGAGLDLDMGHELLLGNLLGEIFVEYAQHSRKEVIQTTSALLGGNSQSHVSVTQLSVIVAPKIAWNFPRFRPWLIPIGVGFLVNSPPSDDSTYLDLGLHFGAGVEVVVFEPFSLGIDVRYTEGFGQSSTPTDYVSVGGYLGISF